MFNGDATVSNNALQLDGEKSYVSIENGKNISIGQGNLTGVITFKLGESASGVNGLIANGALSKGDAGYSFIYDSSNKRFLFYYSNGSKRLVLYTSNNNLNDQKWHTAAFSYDRNKLSVTFALDGRVLLMKNAANMGDNANDASKKLKIGAWGGGYFFVGSIKNVKIYKTAHSSEQLAADTKK
jgi:hypothetical protein